MVEILKETNALLELHGVSLWIHLDPFSISHALLRILSLRFSWGPWSTFWGFSWHEKRDGLTATSIHLWALVEMYQLSLVFGCHYLFLYLAPPPQCHPEGHFLPDHKGLLSASSEPPLGTQNVECSLRSYRNVSGPLCLETSDDHGLPVAFVSELKFTQRKFNRNHLEVHISVAFSAWTRLCNPHVYLVPRHLHPRKGNPAPFKQSFPTPPFPQLPIFILSPWTDQLCVLHVKETMRVMFCVCRWLCIRV